GIGGIGHARSVEAFPRLRTGPDRAKDPCARSSRPDEARDPHPRAGRGRRRRELVAAELLARREADLTRERFDQARLVQAKADRQLDPCPLDAVRVTLDVDLLARDQTAGRRLEHPASADLDGRVRLLGDRVSAELDPLAVALRPADSR